MKAFRILRIIMIIALSVFIALCLYWGIGDLINGKMAEAAFEFICMLIDVCCLAWWINYKL